MRVPTKNMSGWKLVGCVWLVFIQAIFSGCVHRGVQPLPEQFTTIKKVDISSLVSDYTDSLDSHLAFFDAGVAESDRLLEQFFISLDEMQADTKHHQNLFNIVTGGAAGVLGYTGATSKTLGILGVGQAAGNSEFQNLTAAYLLTPTLDLLHKKLITARGELANRLRAKIKEDTTLGEARGYLTQYHASGSLVALRGYLSEATALTSFEVSQGNDFKLSAEVQLLLTRISVRAGTIYSIDQLFLFYLSQTNADLLKIMDGSLPAGVDASTKNLQSLYKHMSTAAPAGTPTPLDSLKTHINSSIPEYIDLTARLNFADRAAKLRTHLESAGAKPGPDAEEKAATPQIRVTTR